MRKKCFIRTKSACLILLVFCFLIPALSFSQINKKDSLLILIENHQTEDRRKVDLLNEYSNKIQDSDHDKAFEFAERAYVLSKELHYNFGLAKSALTIGFEYSLFQLKYDSAAKYALEALRLGEGLNDKAIQARANNCMSMCYQNSNDSLTFLYRQKALDLAKESGNYTLIANYTRNLYLLYMAQKKYKLALEGFRKAIEYMGKSTDRSKEAGIYGAIADLYAQTNNFDSALYYYKVTIVKADESNYERLRTGSRDAISNIYFLMKDTLNGFKYLKESLNIGIENNLSQNLLFSYQILAFREYQRGNYKAAYEYRQASDSVKAIVNEAQSIHNLERMEEKFDQEKKNAVALEEKKRQELILYSGAGVLLIVLVFSVLLYNRFRFTTKQKRIIEEKQKEILDSMRYAKRIQKALMTSDESISKQLNRLRNRGESNSQR